MHCYEVTFEKAYNQVHSDIINKKYIKYITTVDFDKAYKFANGVCVHEPDLIIVSIILKSKDAFLS